MSQPNLLAVDWSKLPVPQDDGAASHLTGCAWPTIALPATDGSTVNLAKQTGRTVLYVYPMMGKPGAALPDRWDDIAGARRCTPQSCAFRDRHADLHDAGAARVFGLSTQATSDQIEAAERLHLPFALLSDASLAVTRSLALPVMQVDGATLLRRMAMIIDDGRITKVFYPVFPPDRNASEVLAWLQGRSS